MSIQNRKSLTKLQVPNNHKVAQLDEILEHRKRKKRNSKIGLILSDLTLAILVGFTIIIYMFIKLILI